MTKRRTDQSEFAMLSAYLGSVFSREELLLFVMQCRAGRSVHVVVDRDLSGSQTGYILSLRDADIIGIAPHLPPLTEDVTLGHEIAHLLCGHLSDDVGSLPAYQDWLASPRLQQQCQRLYRFHEPDAASRVEYEAEALGRLIGRSLATYRMQSLLPFASSVLRAPVEPQESE